MRKEIDARGVACPQPVIETKNTLKTPGVHELVVWVSSTNAREDVTRYARTQGYRVEVMQEGAKEYRITIRKDKGSTNMLPEPESLPTLTDTGMVVFVGCDQIGRGSADLGRMLMGGFLRTWIDMEQKPWRMLFLNAGVHLTTEGSEVLESLQLLEERGVEILSCGTCLDYFNLKEKLKVGRATNMYEILSTLASAQRIITPH